MEVQGKIKLVGETKTFGNNGFRKRELVVTTEEQYPQHIMIEFVQDKCDLLNSYQAGQQVKVSINLRGREWVNPQGETKYFNSIQGWRIENMEMAQQQAPEMPPVPPMDAFEPADDVKKDDFDDLPF
jgi:translation initiation factor IF-3